MTFTFLKYIIVENVKSFYQTNSLKLVFMISCNNRTILFKLSLLNIKICIKDDVHIKILYSFKITFKIRTLIKFKLVKFHLFFSLFFYLYFITDDVLLYVIVLYINIIYIYRIYSYLSLI